MKLANESTLLERIFRTLKDDEQLSPSIRYGSYLALHKYLVGKAMLWRGLPLWRAVIHDAQKLSVHEFGPYKRTFYSGKSPRREDGGYNPNSVTEEFAAAWHHHISSGRRLSGHHFEYWCRANDDKPMKVMEMPEVYRQELLADWQGAGRALVGTWNPNKFYQNNKDRMVFGPETRKKIENDLEDLDLIFKEN